MVRRNGKSQSVSLPLGWDNEWHWEIWEKGFRDHPISSPAVWPHRTHNMPPFKMKRKKDSGMKRKQNSRQPNLKINEVNFRKKTTEWGRHHIWLRSNWRITDSWGFSGGDLEGPILVLLLAAINNEEISSPSPQALKLGNSPKSPRNFKYRLLGPMSINSTHQGCGQNLWFFLSFSGDSDVHVWKPPNKSISKVPPHLSNCNLT